MTFMPQRTVREVRGRTEVATVESNLKGFHSVSRANHRRPTRHQQSQLLAIARSAMNAHIDADQAFLHDCLSRPASRFGKKGETCSSFVVSCQSLR
jgi:hypothetical protein